MPMQWPSVTSSGGNALAGPAASVLVHAALVVAAAIGGSRGGERVGEETVIPEGLQFLVPPSASPTASMITVRYDAAAGADGNATGVEADVGAAAKGSGAGGTDAAATPDAAADVVSAGGAEELADAFEIVDVDSAAVRDPSSASPAYPPELLRAGIEGWAAVRFVVDSTGRVDLATVENLGFTHPQFWDAVREAMPWMRFRPATIRGRPVRQLAEQMFRFEVRKGDTSHIPIPASDR